MSRICWVPSSPEAFSISSTVRDVPAAMAHFINLMTLVTSSSEMWGGGCSMGWIVWGGLGHNRTLRSRGSQHSFQATCIALSSRNNSAASLWTGFPIWTSRFPHFTRLERQNCSLLQGKGSLKSPYCSWNFAWYTEDDWPAARPSDFPPRRHLFASFQAP